MIAVIALLAHEEVHRFDAVQKTLASDPGLMIHTLPCDPTAVEQNLSKIIPLPDLLMLEITPPASDGIAIIERIQLRYPRMAIVAILPFGDHDIAERVIQAGVTDFLSRPMEPSRLQVTIRNALRITRLKRQVERYQKNNIGVEIGTGRNGQLQSKPFNQSMAKIDTENAPHSEPAELNGKELTSSVPYNKTITTGSYNMSKEYLRHAVVPLIDEQGNVRKIEELEADMIRFAIQYYGGHMSEAARRLGIGRSTLYRKVTDLGIGSSIAA